MTQTTNSTPGQPLDEFLGVEPERPWKRWLKWAGLALALILVLYALSRFFGGEVKTSFTTETVERGDLTVTVSATGNIKPINQVDVGSEQSGLITSVFVDVNDRVKKGQLLASLDPSRRQDAVQQARASVAAAKAGVAEAEATLAQVNATLARYREVSRLSGGKVPSKTEMDSARADQHRATAGLASAKAQVIAQQAALGTAETDLAKSRIYSPVTGVVLSRDIEPGQTVAASFNAPVLFIIAEDLGQMELEVSIDEADVGEVKQGQEASFTVDAFPGKRFPARITRVNLGSNESSSSSSSSSTSTAGQVVSYAALLSVDNRDQTLRPGMTATADIVTTRLENVLLVPNTAFRFKPATGDAGAGASKGGITSAIMPRGPRGGATSTRTATTGRGAQQTLYVKDAAGQPQEVTVTTGNTDGQMTVVTSGNLKEGQEVITGQLSGGASGGQGRLPAAGAPRGAAKGGN